jgi:hypothetical protein
MIPTKGQALPPRRVYPLNIIFWQCAGFLIGGLLPGAVLAPIFSCMLPHITSEQDIYRWFWTAGLISPVTAIIGGFMGSIIGLSDKISPFSGIKR